MRFPPALVAALLALAFPATAQVSGEGAASAGVLQSCGPDVSHEEPFSSRGVWFAGSLSAYSASKTFALQWEGAGTPDFRLSGTLFRPGWAMRDYALTFRTLGTTRGVEVAVLSNERSGVVPRTFVTATGFAPGLTALTSALPIGALFGVVEVPERFCEQSMGLDVRAFFTQSPWRWEAEAFVERYRLHRLATAWANPFPGPSLRVYPSTDVWLEGGVKSGSWEAPGLQRRESGEIFAGVASRSGPWTLRSSGQLSLAKLSGKFTTYALPGEPVDPADPGHRLPMGERWRRSAHSVQADIARTTVPVGTFGFLGRWDHETLATDFVLDQPRRYQYARVGCFCSRNRGALGLRAEVGVESYHLQDSAFLPSSPPPGPYLWAGLSERPGTRAYLRLNVTWKF